MKRLTAILLTLAMILTFCACGAKNDAPAAPAANDAAPKNEVANEAVNEAAPGEKTNADYSGTVMLYTSTGESVVLALKEAFEKEYPNVDLQYYYAGSGKVVTKLSTEFETNAVSCDIVWMADPSAQLTWKNEGKLVPYESPYAADIDPVFKDADHMFTGARMVLMGIAYSTMTTSDEEAPYTFWDMADEKWYNQIVMADPSNAGTTKAAVYALTHNEKYGWEFFEALKANGLGLESSSGNNHNKVASGAYKLSIAVDYSIKNLAANDSPVGFHNTTDVVCAVPCPIAIPKGAPNEELAKLFYDWLLNPEGGQKIMANECNMTVTNSKTVIPEGDMPADVAAAVAMEIDWVDLAENGDEMLAKFDQMFK